MARVDGVLAPERAARHHLASGDPVLIVHSGSRDLGEQLLRAHTDLHGAGPAADPAAYLAAHDEAVRWGTLNRRLLVAGHAGPDAGYSVAHGAGRKMSRADALRRGKAKQTVEELRRPRTGSVVVCGDRQLLFEEAPAAYKRIERVIGDLVDHGLATPVLTSLPVVTYKTAELGRRQRGGRR